MKLSEQWLYEWVEQNASREALSSKLTMAGLEVEAVFPVAEDFSSVVVAEVVTVEKHPEADRLKVCQVNTGNPSECITIVCGASNVRPGLKVPAALVGAKLPNNLKITRSKLRNVVSNGMLCSARELGMAEDSHGLLELPGDAPVGMDIRDYLGLSDYVFDISITPNRGDCLSVKGLAKEVAALTEAALKTQEPCAVKPSIDASLKVVIEVPEDCPRYVGRVIKNLKPEAVTPMWMQERLRRSGIRCIHPIVDVTNYVMLELGQPMHAFDLGKINNKIIVRKAKPAETLVTLDAELLELSSDVMVIADENTPIAIAGVMGGLDSGVSLSTQDVFLESAYFNAKSVAYAARKFNLSSDAAYRFERGIDPLGQVEALERATQLILHIAGGEAGPLVEVSHVASLPAPAVIFLDANKMHRLLGVVITDAEVESIFSRLGFSWAKEGHGWQVTVPARRSDVTCDVDLIEEVIRLHGYEKLPVETTHAALEPTFAPISTVGLTSLKQRCANLGYQEVITYSFVDKALQHQFDPYHEPKALLNPISADMAVMRTSLWPGLVGAYLHNQNRQQSRVRLFETGLRFIQNDLTGLRQENMLAGLISGAALPEQWGVAPRPADFFDLKGDLERLLDLVGPAKAFEYRPAQHPALHPGQTADIYRNDICLGRFGAIHPELRESLGLIHHVFLFELNVDHLTVSLPKKYQEISKFPEIRRDIAIFVDQTVPAQAIQDTILGIGDELIKDVTLFDVYQGKGVAVHQKSIALALTLQHCSRTLVDDEVAETMGRVISVLKERFAAELRG